MGRNRRHGKSEWAHRPPTLHLHSHQLCQPIPEASFSLKYSDNYHSTTFILTRSTPTGCASLAGNLGDEVGQRLNQEQDDLPADLDDMEVNGMEADNLEEDEEL
jgi:hypothetical protein